MAEGLKLWTQKDIDKIRRDAKKLVRNPGGIRKYAIDDYAFQLVLTGESAKRLFILAAQATKYEDMVRLSNAAGKMHGEWRVRRTGPEFHTSPERSRRRARGQTVFSRISGHGLP